MLACLHRCADHDCARRPTIILKATQAYGCSSCVQACPLFGALMQKAVDLVRACDCVNDSGCPACIQHPDCGEYNAVLSKRAAVLVLSATLQAEAEHGARMALQVSEDIKRLAH